LSNRGFRFSVRGVEPCLESGNGREGSVPDANDRINKRTTPSQTRHMKTKNRIELTPGAVARPGLTSRKVVPLLAAVVVAGTLLAAVAYAQSAKEIRGATPYAEIDNELPPRLIVDPPLTNLLAQGIVWIQWRVENVRILPVFGKGALNVSPRVGHFHIRVDDLPWLWADASDLNTIDLAGMPPGPHKIRIDLVDANHEAFPGQSKTVKFTVTGTGSHAH